MTLFCECNSILSEIKYDRKFFLIKSQGFAKEEEFCWSAWDFFSESLFQAKSHSVIDKPIINKYK